MIAAVKLKMVCEGEGEDQRNSDALELNFGLLCFFIEGVPLAGLLNSGKPPGSLFLNTSNKLFL